MADCTDTDKLIENEKGHRRGFILLALLTKLHLECLKQIQSGSRDKFPEQQEKVLFSRIEAEVEGLRGPLVQLDAEHLKLAELALIDYKALEDSTLDKQHLVEFLISSYNAISETISGKKPLEGTLSGAESKKVQLLETWKYIVENFNEDRKIKVSLEKTTLEKVDKYLNIRRDADSLYKIYSTIYAFKKYFEEKGTIEEKRLVLQAVLQKVGEYLKSTSDTPNLSVNTIVSLEKKEIPVKLLTNFRDRIMHYHVFLLLLDGPDITRLLNDGLDPIGRIIRDELIKIEKDFVQGLVQENASKITEGNIKKIIGSYANKGVVDLLKYIEQIKGEGGTYHSLSVENKGLVNEINRRAMRMKSIGLPSESEGSSKIELDAKKLEIFEKCIERSKFKLNKKLKAELESWNLDLGRHFSDITKIEEVVGHLQHTAPLGDQAKRGVNAVFIDFLSRTELLDKISKFENNQWVSLKNQLKQYFDVEGFINKLPYSKNTAIGSLIEVLNSVTVNNSENKKKLVDFLKASQKGANYDYLKPDEYEGLVEKLELSTKNEEKLLSYSVEWRRNKCINLLKSNPPALKVICDSIMEGKVIPDRVFRNLAYQYRPEGEDDADTEIRAVSLQQSIESRVGDLYVEEVKKKINALGNLRHPDAMQMQFVSIYSLLGRTRKDGGDTFIIRKLRNHSVHGEQSELFREQFLELIKGVVKKIDTSKEVTLSSFNKAVSDARLELRLPEIEKVLGGMFVESNSGSSKHQNLNRCVQKLRGPRSITICLFSKEDVEKFSKGKVDENNVDKVIIDSEKFLTYVKSTQDEVKNAQLIKFIEGKSVEGDYKYLVDRVIQEQGYERYMQNERVKDLYGGILQKDVGSTKNSKLKVRLINAAGRMQLIRGIHGSIVSCADGDSIDCGLSVSGMAWSFASQPIENVIVKTAPKVVKSAGQFVGKMISGTLGRQAQFAVTFTGVKIGSKIAKGAGGALVGVFDLVDIGMSANNLVGCKKRENSDNPCSEKEIRDNIASISFSGISFISGVALLAASMPGVGTAVAFGIMVAHAIYGGISNIVEYEKRYDTTPDENWSIFWRTLLFQQMAYDVQLLKARGDRVNIKAKAAWKSLNDTPGEVVAYAVGLGQINYDTLSFDAGYGKILMNITNADTENLSRALPEPIQDSEMICLPQFIERAYEKDIKKSIPTAIHYCEDAMVIADTRRKSDGTTIFYNLEDVNKGTIVGSSKLKNYFFIFGGSIAITGGDNTVNRFFLSQKRDFSGSVRGGYNATNIIDLSQSTNQGSVMVAEVEYRFLLACGLNLGLAVSHDQFMFDYVNATNADAFNYIYVGRENGLDDVVCRYDFGINGTDCGFHVLIDSGGGLSKDKRDIVANCKKVAVSPYTKVTGVGNDYTFYIKTMRYKAKDLYSEIDVNGKGTIIFPETNLLNDCSEIAYSLNSNTLSLKIEIGQGNQYTLDIKNYIKQDSNQPNFILIDKNGSNITPQIQKLEPSFTRINSFTLHTEFSIDSFEAAENHYKEKILGNNSGYKIFGVVRAKLHGNSVFQSMIFGSSASDMINFDQSMFVRGGDGGDVYVVENNNERRVIIIDNNSDDKVLDVLVMPEVPKEFSIQQCDLHFNWSDTHVQVRNYLQDNSYRHLMVVSSKGESFIPYIPAMSCAQSSTESGKLVLFFHATPSQNIFLLHKDVQYNHVVIDSCLEEIERYKDRDDLLLVRVGEIPFIVKIEDFYNDRSKWEGVNFLLWNNGNFSPYSGLYQGVDGVMNYQDKLKDDYEKSIKEYEVDFTKSFNIEHNQDSTSTSIGDDEKLVGVMILRNITPGRVQVSSNGRDVVFSDKVSKHVISVKNWNSSESYRISTLEFDLGLEPIVVTRLDQFSSSEIGEMQGLINKAFEFCEKRDGLELNKHLSAAVQNGDFSEVKDVLNKCVSINAQDKNGCTPLHYAAVNGNLEVVKYIVEKGADFNVKDNLTWTPLHFAAMYGKLGVVKYLKGIGASLDVVGNNEWTPLHVAAIDNKPEVVRYLVEEGANVNAKDKHGKTPLDLARRRNYNNIVDYLEKLNVKVAPKQRKRRHHHGDDSIRHLSPKPLAIDSSNQIAASSGAKPSSWINDLFGWIKSSIGGLLSPNPEETSSAPSPVSQVDAQMDVNGTIMLLDLLIRKVTGQKYVSSVERSISLLEAQGYALNITEGFEKALNETAIKSGIPVTNLNLDSVAVQTTIVGQIVSERFSEISKILYSFAKEVCPEFKQTDKFLAHLKSNLEEVLAKEETIILQQKVGHPAETSEVSSIPRRVVVKELPKNPVSFLSGSSVGKGISNVLER